MGQAVIGQIALGQGAAVASGLEVLERPRGEVAPAETARARRGAGGGDGGRGGEGGSGGGGPGGSGGSGDGEPADLYQPSIPISAPVFAMVLLMCTVVMLFAGLVASYMVFRIGAGPNWPPAGLPALPAGLWIPTLIVLASSVTMGLAQRSAKAGDQEGLRLRLGMTTALGVAFVAAQMLLWRDLWASGLDIRQNVYGAIFYVLTGLHAFHMVTGLITLAAVFVKARRGRYSARSHVGVRVAAIYWHFLDALWVFLFAILYLV